MDASLMKQRRVSEEGLLGCKALLPGKKVSVRKCALIDGTW